MATKRWRGDAPAVAQVDTITVTAYGAATTYKITINGKVVSVVGSGGTTTTVATALTTALNDSTIPEFAEITWTSATNVITGTADTKGKPFTATSSVSGGTGTIGAVTSSTANSGPNVVSVAANWEGAAVPADADDVIFDQGESDVKYDLDQNGVTPATIKVLPGYKGNIGLPVVNSDDAANTYFEYRETYLKYGNSGDAQAVTVTVNGGGGRIKISQGTAQATWNVLGTANRLEDGIPTLLLKGTHASNALNVSKGDVGVAFYGGETATLLTVNVGYQTNPAGDSQVVLESGVTLTAPTITQTGGTLEVNSAITGASVVAIYDGTYTQQGTGGIAAGLAVRGGECRYNSTGTLGGAPVISGSGHLDFSQDLRTKTVTNAVDMYGPNAKISDPHKSVTTLVIDLDETVNSENIKIGTNFRITRGSVS